MVGQITYTEDQILFVLRLTLAKEKRDVIQRMYQERFGKPLTDSQLRYVKSKYGHDPEFGTALINRTLPNSGGDRKTASSPPGQNTTGPIQIPSHTPYVSPRLSVPNPTASAELQNLLLPSSSAAFSASTQPSTLAQAPATHSPTRHDASAQFIAAIPATAPGIPSDVTTASQPPAPTTAMKAVYDHNNPYGVQLVLQQYRASLQTTTIPKRKREEPLTQGSITIGFELPSPSSDSESVNQDISKRLKLDSSEPPSMPEIVQQTALHAPSTAESPHDMLHCAQPGDADAAVARPLTPLSQLLSNLDDRSWIENTPASAPPSLHFSQAGDPDPFGDALVSQLWMTKPTEVAAAAAGAAAMPVIPAPAMTNAQSTSSYANLTFPGSEMEEPFWNPLLDDASATVWAGAPTLSNYPFPITATTDTVVDPSLAQDIDASSLLNVAGNNEPDNGTTERFDQIWWDLGDAGHDAASVVLPPDLNAVPTAEFADTLVEFYCQQPLSIDGDGSSDDEEFQPYNTPLE